MDACCPHLEAAPLEHVCAVVTRCADCQGSGNNSTEHQAACGEQLRPTPSGAEAATHHLRLLETHALDIPQTPGAAPPRPPPESGPWRP